MASSTNTENTRIAMENLESFLSKFASHSPALLDDIHSAGTIMKQTNMSNLNSLRQDNQPSNYTQARNTVFFRFFLNSSSATCDLPSNIAVELRLAAEAADGKQFFTCCQKIKTASYILQMLMAEAKSTRRKIDSLSVLNTPAREELLPLQKHCIYLEEALSLLYALNLDLHEVQLTANALYVHGLKDDTPRLQEMDKLKDAIARL
uniref:Uncharacterized protein n=1 Tax=Anopheles minimus TaxID=112268 RepID=A0A182W5V3_9DIPT